ncbi:carboxypeptidase-like regulatory domain-containing protein [Ferruginibacter sp.]
MQKIQLSIPEPCHQNWNEMTATQQGRFCNSCAKQVVDFSTMSDTEVLHYFSSIKNENVCGRAYPDQLERAISKTKEPKKKLFWYWNYITMLFLFFSKTNTAKAQGGIKVVTESKIDAAKQDRITKGEIAVNTNRIITGKIIDEAGQPLPGASIIIKGSKNGTSADVNGFYKINVDTKSDILEITAVGFERKEIKLTSLNSFDIILSKMEMELLGALVITSVKIDEQGYVYTPIPPKHIAIIEVKDNATLQPITKAAVVIKRIGTNKSDAVFTDKKGIYKLRKIEEGSKYSITITAAGFKEEEIQITCNDFDERKITKQIFIEKLPELADYKKMDSVLVTSYGNGRRFCRVMGSISMVSEQRQSILKDTLKTRVSTWVSKNTSAVKIYPNPIQRGNSFSLSLKLKQAGMYNIQIVDAAGRVVLQKQTVALAKTHTEQMQTNSIWSSGIYYIRIFNDKNNFISTNSFSLQ